MEVLLQTSQGELKLKKIVFIITTFVLVLSTFGISNNVAQASESVKDNEIISAANNLAEKYGFEVVSDEIISTDARLYFDSIEEFESFLKKEKEYNQALKEVNSESVIVDQKVASLMAASSTTPKEYTFKEYTGVSVITSYARVTRNSAGIVTDVKVWSQQTGINVPIKYLEDIAWYELNAKKTGGKGIVKGTKFYGVNVVGQEFGYSASVTYTVPF